MEGTGPMPDARAQLRAQLLLDVLAGKITATQAAETLKVSRKTWHEWQQRGLEGMLQGLSDRPTGRPPQERDPEKEQLLRQLRQRELQIALLEQSCRIQNSLRHLPPAPGRGDGSKKNS